MELIVIVQLLSYGHEIGERAENTAKLIGKLKRTNERNIQLHSQIKSSCYAETNDRKNEMFGID